MAYPNVYAAQTGPLALSTLDANFNWAVDIQNQALIASAGGGADAITATYSPVPSALINGLTLYVRAALANATTAPTFSPNGLTARAIVKANGIALAVGDIAGAGHWLQLTYDTTLTAWVLANPGGLNSKFTSTGLNATPIGATTPSTVAATTLSTTGAATVGAGLAVTGAISATGTAATDATSVSATGTTTGFNRFRVFNTTGDLRMGVENSTGGGAVSGSTAYSSWLGSFSNTPLHLVTNNVIGATLDASGNLLVNTASVIGKANVSQGGSAPTLYVENTNGSLSSSVILSKVTGTVAGTGFNHYAAQNSTSSTVFQVQGNGNVQNTNNSYGAISDVKLKENIVDATPKLAGLMNVRIVNYNLKTDPDHKQLGVIAQELEQVFPALVDETPDRDAEGNDLGTVTKSVKYSVFVPMLIKAIQEQQAQITALTQRLTAAGIA